MPGGRREEGDKDDEHTATREAEEEIGLNTSLVDVIAVLEPFFSKVHNIQWFGTVTHTCARRSHSHASTSSPVYKCILFHGDVLLILFAAYSESEPGCRHPEEQGSIQSNTHQST